MEERNYKLYVHISPSNKRYYGITGQNIKDRWSNGHGYKGNKHFTNAINKYGWENFEHIVLFDNLTGEEAGLLEQMYIALYNTTNTKYGYNQSYGGQINKGYKRSKEDREQNSERMKQQWADPNSIFNSQEYIDRRKAMYNDTEFRKKQSKKMQEIWKNEEYRQSQIETRKIKMSDPEYREWYSQQNSEHMKKAWADPNSIFNSEEFRLNRRNAMLGHFVTDECKRKISEAHKGRKHTEQARKNMSEAQKGKKLSEQCKHKISERNKKMWADPNSGFNSKERNEKISKALKGKKMSEEAKKKLSERQKGENNNHAKVILMYTLDGVFIKKFNCIADANEYLGKKRTYSGIGECLKGKTKSCNGYMWKYMDDEINYNIQPYNNEYQYIGKNHPQSKPILMYDLQGNFIKRFNCNREASEYLGKEGINTSISACASGKTRSAYGYIWIYQTNDNYPKKLSKKYVDEVKNLKKGKNHPQAKAVLMFTLHGEFIRRFDCIKDANEYLGKPRNSVNINMNASGKSKSAFGYKWIYEENYIKEQKEAI